MSNRNTVKVKNILEEEEAEDSMHKEECMVVANSSTVTIAIFVANLGIMQIIFIIEQIESMCDYNNFLISFTSL
jgi:putative heme degradation protein